ncbi:unnamed protein product [Caenorhabditis angaria]|uniref:Saposin A-type domain-containing protein n=1 Tax=Caenorhabditis angaria TaxID=860376 RepID=A0A9P1ID99_9PELO|nr:unnamed protein product [Caenorhabditis angaria]
MLGLLIFLTGLSLTLGAAPDCAKIPPSLWCANPTIQSTCGFTEPCKKHEIATSQHKLNITVLVEALCPDCQQFLTKQLYPVIFKNFADYVNIQLVPFGNAKVLQDGTIQCQHGEQECSINKFQSCFIDSMADQNPLPAIACIEENLAKKVEFADAVQQCFEKLQIGGDVQRLTQSCLVSKLGTQLQLQAAKATSEVWPEQHKFVPWVVVNGVSLVKLQGFQNDLAVLICEWYSGDKPIPFCEASLKKKYRNSSVRLFSN